jgi:hypothetical protein
MSRRVRSEADLARKPPGSQDSDGTWHTYDRAQWRREDLVYALGGAAKTPFVLAGAGAVVWYMSTWPAMGNDACAL